MPLKKQAEPEEQPAGAPEWMVTFSDCMTLLLTFFVLLLSFSSFDDRIFRQLKEIFAESLPATAPENKTDRDAFLPVKQIQVTAELDEGSEKPTFNMGFEDRTKQDTEPPDFHSRKVFLIESKRIFYGYSEAISTEGRNIMSILASFLKEVPSRVVISENGPDEDEDSEKLGLPRAWAVLNYLATVQNLDKDRFSISAGSTLDQAELKSGKPAGSRSETERTIEIVLLERSIYN